MKDCKLCDKDCKEPCDMKDKFFKLSEMITEMFGDDIEYIFAHAIEKEAKLLTNMEPVHVAALIEVILSKMNKSKSSMKEQAIALEFMKFFNDLLRSKDKIIEDLKKGAYPEEMAMETNNDQRKLNNAIDAVLDYFISLISKSRLLKIIETVDVIDIDENVTKH